jgi:hypothetical protein
MAHYPFYSPLLLLGPSVLSISLFLLYGPQSPLRSFPTAFVKRWCYFAFSRYKFPRNEPFYETAKQTKWLILLRDIVNRVSWNISRNVFRQNPNINKSRTNRISCLQGLCHQIGKVTSTYKLIYKLTYKHGYYTILVTSFSCLLQVRLAKDRRLFSGLHCTLHGKQQ